MTMRYSDIVETALDTVYECHSRGESAYYYVNGYVDDPEPHYLVPAIKYEVYVLDWLVLITHETSAYELVDLFIMIE
jgi:hypothetical protein